MIICIVSHQTYGTWYAYNLPFFLSFLSFFLSFLLPSFCPSFPPSFLPFFHVFRSARRVKQNETRDGSIPSWRKRLWARMPRSWNRPSSSPPATVGPRRRSSERSRCLTVYGSRSLVRILKFPRNLLAGMTLDVRWRQFLFVSCSIILWCVHISVYDSPKKYTRMTPVLLIVLPILLPTFSYIYI